MNPCGIHLRAILQETLKLNPCYELENCWFKITTPFPWGQCVKAKTNMATVGKPHFKMNSQGGKYKLFNSILQWVNKGSGNGLVPYCVKPLVNTLRPRQNGRYFPDDRFKCIFLNQNVWIPIKVSLEFVPEGSINNIPALVQMMAWHRQGDKPLSEPMMVRPSPHLCVTRLQWVNPMMIKTHNTYDNIRLHMTMILLFTISKRVLGKHGS